MGAALLFIQKNWQYCVIAALTLAVVVIYSFLRVAQAERKEALSAYLVIAERIKDQNSAIIELEKTAEEHRKAAAKALAVAQAVSSKHKESAKALSESLKKIEPPKTSCPAGEGVDEVKSILRGKSV